MAGLELINISKQYKDSSDVTLSNIDLKVDEDEFLVLLGPSGCGKTTILKLVSGLLSPSEGRIILDGKDITELPPQEREIGMVFQNYALYPHMNVRKNLSFALELKHLKKKDISERIGRIGDVLGLQNSLSKKPDQLSGGERQRVSMGRAMVNDCRLYLFDEPLSNLDEALRSRLRPEILEQFHRLHVPFVYVTHDQQDAMTMATKVAVMKDGKIQQLASPNEIYNAPANTFVASFVGSPKMNMFEGQLREDPEDASLVKIESEIASFCISRPSGSLKAHSGGTVLIGIRAEDIHLKEQGPEDERVSAVLSGYEYSESRLNLTLSIGNKQLNAFAPISLKARMDERLDVFLDKSKLHFFDPESGVRI